jgi:hypothetical protein
MQLARDPRGRSSITNGRHLHRGADGRSHEARRWRDLFNGFRAELGKVPTTTEESLLRSAASLALASETLAAQLVTGKRVDDGELNQLSGSLRRTLMSLGLAVRVASPEPSDPDHNLEGLMRR